MHLAKTTFPKFPSALHVNPANYTLIDKAIKGHFWEEDGLGSCTKNSPEEAFCSFPMETLCGSQGDTNTHHKNVLWLPPVWCQRSFGVCVCVFIRAGGNECGEGSIIHQYWPSSAGAALPCPHLDQQEFLRALLLA